MALTSYQIVVADNPKTLAALVKPLVTGGKALVGGIINRNPGCFQVVGDGTYDIGKTTDYQVIVSDTPANLAAAVTAVLTTNLQPIAAPIVRQNTLVQLMGKVT